MIMESWLFLHVDIMINRGQQSLYNITIYAMKMMLKCATNMTHDKYILDSSLNLAQNMNLLLPRCPFPLPVIGLSTMLVHGDALEPCRLIISIRADCKGTEGS